ncbi:hypothetical protein A5715_05705 [Mycolicibacter heraklionensis]|nr:hypothetical protein A5715_05705 [Mycolicibacter heraklionensis]
MPEPPLRPVPVPTPRPPRTDIVFAQHQPLTSVAIAFAGKTGPIFRFHACSTTADWSGHVTADSLEVAVLDVIRQIHVENPTMGGTRFLVNLTASNMLWRHAPEISVLLPGVTVEMPRHADLPLMRAAKAALAAEAPPPTPPACRSGPIPSIWVATDGSVRGEFTGYGWLASTGEYGMCGFRHSTRQIGRRVVLIAELRAVHAAVSKLRRRHLTVLSDSCQAIAMLQRWTAGSTILPAGYTTERADGRTAGLVLAQRKIHTQRNRLSFSWVKSHQGHPLNEGADALARLASRYAAGAQDLTAAEYRRRAAGLATAFAEEFRRTQRAGVELPLPR